MSEQNSKPYEMTEHVKTRINEILELVERNGGMVLIVGHKDGGKEEGLVTQLSRLKGIKKYHAIQVALDFFEFMINA
jgi:hypothetical protein